MMGSMGCLASVGFALAREHPNKRVYVLDGDGALLMKMGTLSTIGYHGPDNLVHICFDNAAYESTGCQPTTSSTTDFAAIANACGYPSVNSVESLADFTRTITGGQDLPGPHFITVRIASGTIENLPRPAEDAVTMARAFSRALGR
jgi:phosphonopyruvate decarboxylase